MYLNGDNVDCGMNATDPMLLCLFAGSREVD